MKTKLISKPFGKMLFGAAILLSASLLTNDLKAQTIDIGPNQYAFRFTQNPNYGLFFNATNVRYEFRNGAASPIFAFNADNGNMTTDLQFASGNTIRVAPGNYAFRSPAAPNAGLFFGATDYELRTTTGAAAFSVSAINSNAVFAGSIAAQGGNSTQWNQAHSWGNHASAGYISSETDPKISGSLDVSSVPRWNGTQLTTSSITAGLSSATIKGSPGLIGTGTLPGGYLLTLSNPGTGSQFSTGESRLAFVKEDILKANLRTSADNFIVESNSPGSLIMRAGGADRMTINSAGNIGIGASPNSSAKLAVNGQVLATQVRVLALANWPDYVFADDYKLMSLEELAGYIKTEKHLPGIPSASEMESDESMDLGEMQRRTIEKVEELTLYILELKQLSDQLQSENNALQQRIETLESK